MKNFSVPTRVVAALVVGIVAAPVASTGIASLRNAYQVPIRDAGYTNPETSAEIRRSAALDRRRVRIQRRQYWQAIERYQRLLRSGKDVRKPNFNNPEEIETYLSGGWVSTVEEVKETQEEREAKEKKEQLNAAAPSKPHSSVTDPFTVRDRKLLRSYVRARSCPESLKHSALIGFYALCRSMVGVDNVRDTLPVGRLNEKARRTRMHLAAPASMKLRRQMIREAYDSTRRRSPGERPGRPSAYKGLLGE